MSSIGNDIIALKTIDKPRTQNPRFYTKILSAAEQNLYRQHFTAIPFEYFVWLLWSVKESAYKCLQRHQPGLVFSPVKIAVTHLALTVNRLSLNFSETMHVAGFNHDECFKSVVSFGGQTLYARSIIFYDELIYTVASHDQDFSGIHWGIKRISKTDPESQSIAVRELVLDKLTPVFPAGNLSIEKSASGYPFVAIAGKDTGMPISFSHHGEWIGYGIVVNNTG